MRASVMRERGGSGRETAYVKTALPLPALALSLVAADMQARAMGHEQLWW